MRILPMPWPPREPEPQPGPESLTADIDWMSYSHRELYAMVHRWTRGRDLAALLWILRQMLEQSGSI